MIISEICTHWINFFQSSNQHCPRSQRLRLGENSTKELMKYTSTSISSFLSIQKIRNELSYHGWREMISTDQSIDQSSCTGYILNIYKLLIRKREAMQNEELADFHGLSAERFDSWSQHIRILMEERLEGLSTTCDRWCIDFLEVRKPCLLTVQSPHDIFPCFDLTHT